MGFFNRIFSKKEEIIDPIDISFLRNDIHSHLIPGIDDGSPEMETTIVLLKKFIDLGYKKVITTPHVMSDYYKNNPEIILSGLNNVRKEIKKQNLNIEIEAAAEYNLEPEFEKLLDDGKLLSFGAEKFLLFELSFFDEPLRLNETIWKMIEKGFRPVLAHVERYGYWHNNYDKIEEMINRGVKLQLNIGSVTGAYGPEVKKFAERLIKDEIIEFVGSDCHHLHHLEMINHAIRLPIFHSLVKQSQILNKSL
jgi:tyrosine-protein phosphatase YwqE